MPFGLLGVQLGAMWRRGIGWPATILTGTILATFGFFFRIWLVSILLGDDLWLYFSNQITELAEWIFVKLGLLVQPVLWQIQAIAILMVAVQNLIYLFVVHLVAWLLLERLGNPIPTPPRWVEVLMDVEAE
jgi:uncharacterized protein YybS (DUF2232 family)